MGKTYQSWLGIADHVETVKFNSFGSGMRWTTTLGPGERTDFRLNYWKAQEASNEIILVPYLIWMSAERKESSVELSIIEIKRKWKTGKVSISFFFFLSPLNQGGWQWTRKVKFQWLANAFFISAFSLSLTRSVSVVCPLSMFANKNNSLEKHQTHFASHRMRLCCVLVARHSYFFITLCVSCVEMSTKRSMPCHNVVYYYFDASEAFSGVDDNQPWINKWILFLLWFRTDNGSQHSVDVRLNGRRREK